LVKFDLILAVRKQSVFFLRLKDKIGQDRQKGPKLLPKIKSGSSGGGGAAFLYKKEGFGEVGWEARIRT